MELFSHHEKKKELFYFFSQKRVSEHGHSFPTDFPINECYTTLTIVLTLLLRCKLFTEPVYNGIGTVLTMIVVVEDRVALGVPNVLMIYCGLSTSNVCRNEPRCLREFHGLLPSVMPVALWSLASATKFDAMTCSCLLWSTTQQKMIGK